MPKDNISGEMDYVFRFPVEEDNNPQKNPLVEMVRKQLESTLGLLTFYHKGVEVKVDGFKFFNEGETIHSIFRKETQARDSNPEDFAFQALRKAEVYEPRIPHIKRVLESLLSVVEPEEKGRSVKVDGFRLRNLSDWLISSTGDPAEVFDHLATRCDCHCVFCYLKGNPPSLAIDDKTSRSPKEEYHEARTRLKYFSSSQGRALFPSMGSQYEILSHPFSIGLMEELRKKTDRPFRLSTNGNSLTEDLIRKLAPLKPLYLYLSLNSFSPERRAHIMRGIKTEVGIKALPLLAKYKIPYATIIVPWPLSNSPSGVDEMLADFDKTVRYADQQDTHLIEVSLPGYTRYFSENPIFDLDELWGLIVRTVEPLRRNINSPLLVKPSLYEENLYSQRLNLPKIVGVVKNSPAAFSGLKAGDLVFSINGLNISSRPQALDILYNCRESGHQRIPIMIQRAGEPMQVELRLDIFDYPYTGSMDYHFGIIFMGTGFRTGNLERLKSLILAYGAKRVLFLSSRLVKPTFDQALKESFFGSIDIDVIVPENRFFGGNIFMGDLLVVQDFIETIRDYLNENATPDLIVIPSSPFCLGDWRRDLEGKPYSHIERAIGIHVALLECEPIYD